jgi:DNA-binding response OmpR family regulator
MENKKRILIIDDDENICKLLDSRLKSWGFDTDIARDGKDPRYHAHRQNG